MSEQDCDISCGGGQVIHTGLVDPSRFTEKTDVHMDWVPCEQDGFNTGLHWEVMCSTPPN
jgi:hypothetical protein